MNQVVSRSLTILLLLCSNIVPARAQNESPWPPNAADIFVSSVEVLDFAMLDKMQQIPLGQIVLDPDMRVIKGADGRVYPWPDSVGYFRFTANFPIVIDSKLYLYQSKNLDSDIDSIWTLNLKTGSFAEYIVHEAPATPCGKVWPKRMGWDYYAANGQSILCNQTTGQRLPFPQDYDLAFTTSAEPFALDLPDNRLLFVGKSQQNNEFAVFVYNPTAQALDTVGTLPFGEHLTYEMKSPDILLIEVDRASGDRRYGIFHLSSTSFTVYRPPLMDTSIVSQWRFWPRPNLAIFNTFPNNTCNIILYDLVANKEQLFDFGNLCDANYTDADGTGYYREISADKKTATIVRFNPITKERKEIYKGEVEGIQWASKDDRYLMLIIDDSGQIDLMPNVYIGPNTSGSGTLKLIDTQYGLVGFKSQAYINYTAMGWTPSVTQIIPNWLAIRYTGYDMEYESLLMHLSTDGITIKKVRIENRINDEWTTFSDEHSIGLYHIKDDRRVPIFNAPIKPNYLVNSLVPLGDGRFQVAVTYSNWPAEDPPDQKAASFIIRLSDINLPATKNVLPYSLSSDDGVF